MVRITGSYSKNVHEKMSKKARFSFSSTCRLTWLSAIMVIALMIGPRASVVSRTT